MSLKLPNGSPSARRCAAENARKLATAAAIIEAYAESDRSLLGHAEKVRSIGIDLYRMATAPTPMPLLADKVKVTDLYECDDDNHQPGCQCPGVVDQHGIKPPTYPKNDARAIHRETTVMIATLRNTEGTIALALIEVLRLIRRLAIVVAADS